MKHLIRAGSTIVLLLIAGGCKEDTNALTTGSQNGMVQEEQSTNDAHPAIAIKALVAKEDKKNYQAIAVMDSDGTHRTPVFIAATPAYNIYSPSWSPNGGSIAFHAAEGSTLTINVITISLAYGKPVGSHFRTIYTVSNSVQLRGLSWAPSSNKIAFISRDTGSDPINRLQVISAFGGVPTELYRSSTDYSHTFNSPTWSPDGSKIAFIDHVDASIGGEASPDTLRVVDGTSGALLESVGLFEAVRTTSCEWSHAGMNTIVFDADDILYYVTPVAGSTPWTNNAVGRHPSWSPDNSSIITYFYGLQKTDYNSVNTSMVDTGACSFPEWRKALRPIGKRSVRREQVGSK